MDQPNPAEQLPGLEVASTPLVPTVANAPTRPRVKAVDRSQLTWQMLDVEGLIEQDHPARAIWDLVGRLKLEGFYAPIEAVEGSAGRTPWDPRLLISLWIYAYSRGISSAREIARRCTYEPAFQWLCGLGEMDLKLIREQSIQTAKQLGVDVSPTLPLLDAGLEMRGADEAISRLLAMNAVAAIAYGFDKTK